MTEWKKIQELQTYITIKDHTDNFSPSISCRLINPSKTDVGKISKTILDKINIQLVPPIKFDQWKNSNSVINWFKNIPEKKSCTFIVIDIENFYPTISLELFNKVLQFAKGLCKITDKEIMQARKTLLFKDSKQWVRKSENKDFDVPMGCFDGAEVSEIVGTYILSKISNEINKKQAGLYRDDGLCVIRNMPGSKMDRTKKNRIKIFQQCSLL